jgi:hypothetical protein
MKLKFTFKGFILLTFLFSCTNQGNNTYNQCESLKYAPIQRKVV